MVRTRVEERDEIAAIELRQDEVTIERIFRGVPVRAATLDGGSRSFNELAAERRGS